MAEYWKSTPSYWCKFCSGYVRDTAIERKNHEATAKHQNNIQRSLRDLHKNQERERREKQTAKDEVARLNGLFGGGKVGDSSKIANKSSTSTPRIPPPPASHAGSAAQRKLHAEQLAALGVELPEELKKEVTGVGNYRVVSEREVEPARGGAVSVNRSLAEVLADAKRAEEEDTEGGYNSDPDDESGKKRTLKRKADEDEEFEDEESAPKRKAWGSNIKTYPGKSERDEDGADLDALLSGVLKTKEPAVKTEKTEDGTVVKTEGEGALPLDNPVMKEAKTGTVPAVVFKKRKGKK